MKSIIRSLNVIAAHVDPYYLKTSSNSLLQYLVFISHSMIMRKKLIFDYLVTQNSIANANKLAWSAERKNDLYAYGRPPKARTWPHYLKNDIEYVFLFGLDLDYN